MLESSTGWGDSLARLGIDRAQFVDTLNRLCFLRPAARQTRTIRDGAPAMTQQRLDPVTP